MSTIKKGLFLVGDIAVFYISLAAMILARYRNLATFKGSFDAHLGPFSAILIIWALAFYWNNLYQYRTFGNRSWLIKALARAIAIATAGSIIAFYLFPRFFELTPRANLFIFAAIFLLLSYLWREFALLFSSSGKLNVIIAGTSPLTEEAAHYLEQNKDADYNLVRWLNDTTNGELNELQNLVRSSGAQLVVMQQNLAHNFSALRSLYKLLPLEVSVVRFSDFYETLFEKEPLRELEENWFIENISTRRPAYDTIKRSIDIVIAVITGLVFLIPGICIALLVKFSSKGPIIYRQERTGKNGKKFIIYKFRTMRADTKGPAWTEKNDSRITKVGAILRFTHLDELPQLINILKNDISLVGPRPESSELSAQYERFPYYEIRHVVKPGLTGWAQVRYKPSTSLEEAYEKLCYDVYYIKNRSIFLDLVIFLRTIKYLFTSYAKQ